MNVKLKNSFKMTELGLIPNDWEVKCLGDVTELNMGKTPSRSVKTFWGKGHSWLSIADLKEKFIFETKEEITELGAFKMQIIPKGTLVMSFKLSIGKLAFVGNDMYSNEAICNFQKPRVCSDYLYYILSRTDFSQYGKQAVKGYTLNTASLKSIQISIPPLPEQKAIAGVLSDVDELIAALDKLITKKQNIKQAAMQNLLTGKIRLPGYGGTWELLKMSQDATINARIGWQGLTTSEYLSQGEYYLVTGTDFQFGKINWSTANFVAKERYLQDIKIQLSVGDVLLTKDGSIGKVAYIGALLLPATLNSGVFVIRPKTGKYEPLFFYHIMNSLIFKEFLTKLSAGSTISHLYQKDFQTFQFLSPPLPEQKAIAEVLSDMDNEIMALQKRRDKIKLVKKGLMQELLTGRIRLV